ncbi:unnamed protein product [Acanthoscelides obtectus]|uniref:Tesmin/TSO1-like CXC domain-containing protein n=1 Tax=Acanthoscelides obtectus TaxID=200917 RepID=A0A9P0JSF3_ACAOB|nr:unnamed protein product [Acanthoscelides obtectus]CAK1663658.1 hypothetical protein AOBTE_LOCUS23779 [Acanthoscelides obtectus]
MNRDDKMPLSEKSTLFCCESHFDVSCGCQWPCKSKRYNCRKAGLKCNSACKVCRGKSCNNSKRWTATEHHDSETPMTTDACEEDGGQTTIEPDNDDLTEDDEPRCNDR